MSKLLLFPVAAFLCLAIAPGAQTPGPAPRLDQWTILGPGGGGTTIGPVISPSDPNLVIEHCDMTGAYITHDGGLSWRMFNLRNGLETFAFDPKNQNRIYAAGAALWRSDDAGQTWRMLFPDPRKRTVEHQNGDHADYSLSADDGEYVRGLWIREVVVDPSNTDLVHIAFADPSTQGISILSSKDAGATFHHEFDIDQDRILLLAYPGGERLVVGEHGVYRGKARKPVPIAKPAETVKAATIGSEQGKTYLYATTSSGRLFVSEDLGATWQPRTPGLGQKAGEFRAIATSTDHGLTAYAGFHGLELGAGAGDTFNGIARPPDAGHPWSIVFRESHQPASNLNPSWIEQRATAKGTNRNASIFFDTPYSLAVAPANPDICYAADLFRTYRTLDGGKAWEQVNSARAAEGRWTTRGLDVTTSYGVQFDPFDTRHIFIDYTDIGLFQSQDGGRSWESSTTGVPENWRNTTYWLAFDPAVRGLLWGAFSGTHDLPRPKMWRHRSPDQFSGGVGVSVDGGRSWTPSNQGMEESAITHILLDPASPAGSRTLYACAFGRGVYKSTDGGKTWQLKNEGIEEQKPFAWRIVQGGNGALFLIVARSNEGRAGATAGAGAIYKSVDGAEHWTPIHLPAGVNGPSGLALDPTDNYRMYLAAWGQEQEGVDTGGGVYLSTDGGKTWKLVESLSQHVYDVTIDPRTPGTLYISGFDAGAYRSTDAGLHWARIQGYNFKWGHRVIRDPADPTQIYIATYGGSVWHGPAAGDPQSQEDILTPVPVAH